MKLILEINSYDELLKLKEFINLFPSKKENIDKNIKIDALGLTLRTTACLQVEGIKTINDLFEYCKHSSLLDLPNLGKKSFNEINAALVLNGFCEIKL